jgi:hypothetical protein
VLALAGGEPDPRFPNPPTVSPVRLVGEVKLHNYPGHIRSLDAIDRAAAGRGLMNAGPADQVVRRVPLVAMVQGVVVPSLGVETLRVALGAPLTLSTDGSLLDLRFGEVHTQVQLDGTTWLRMGPHDDERFNSAHDVLSGNVRAERPARQGGARRQHGIEPPRLQDHAARRNSFRASRSTRRSSRTSSTACRWCARRSAARRGRRARDLRPHP